MPVLHRALLAALVIAIVALFPAVSASGAASYKTEVIVSLKFPAFHGGLRSKRGSCLSDRKVKLFREGNGTTRMLGVDTSNRKGKWSIPIGRNLKSGGYYAKVSARGNCRGGKSQVLPID